MSITGSNNPFACEPVVFANANSIISLGTITRNGNQFTFSVGFVWKINGVTYQNTAPVVITIAEASEGFNRIDNALLNTSNTIELQQGLESETIALKPVAPDTNIVLTSWNITGNTIGNVEDPVIGTAYVKKSFSAHFAFNGSGVDTSIPLNPNGYSEIRVTNPALESIAGVDLSLISGNPSAEVPYTGKIYLLKNITGNAITIKHNSAIADIPFFTIDEQNLEVPNKGAIIFTYDNGACDILLTNFSVGTVSIPSLDEVLEVSGYSERSATVGDFKAKSFQIGDNLMPESSGGLFKVQKNADGTISVVLDSVSHEDSDNFGILTATLTNEGGVIFRHLDNDNNQGVIATIRKDGIIFYLINSFLKVYKDGSDRDILISGIAQINDIFGLGLALNNKADLVGGKVPASQSQPSTMVMNNSTYVITFTDATGAVQSIDLPLESLFQDANYDETTKSLIVTLQDGTTRTIPLSDLVDLPEIVLATSNPAVTPTSGQKVYFNTSLGKVWFNVSGTWTYAGNLISDSEKANLSTAYNHSQATGNPHNTKVEELSDVSGDAISIVDADAILKKESGGIWRKITWANIKDNLKTYFDSIYTTQIWVNSQGFITNVITALGYTPENSANKSTSTSDSESTTKFPVWSAIVSYFSASQIRSILGISTLSGSNTGDQDLSGLALKQMSAYSMRVNNTNATANATEIPFQQTGKGTYTGTITWTGITAPSGTTSHSYNWQRVGNLVTLNITLVYGTAGTSLTSVSMGFMNDFPTPVKPDGLTAASNILYPAFGKITTSETTGTTGGFDAYLRSNSSNNGFEFVLNQAALNAKIVRLTILYFTE